MGFKMGVDLCSKQYLSPQGQVGGGTQSVRPVGKYLKKGGNKPKKRTKKEIEQRH